MIQGEEREIKEFKKYVGVGEFHVLGFNFDRDTIKQRCGYDPGVDQVYNKDVTITKDGQTMVVKTSNINVFLKEKNTGSNMRLSFHLEQRDDISTKGSTKYVNVKCQNSYVLAEWFIKNEYRKAYIGEGDFLNFMRNWLSNFKWFEEGVGGAKYPLKETDTLFKGNFNAINDLAKRYNKQTVGVLCGVRDTERGEKQDTCNRAFLPGYLVPKVQQVIKGLPDTERDKQVYAIKEFLKSVEGEYGYKNFYGNNYSFREYDPKTNVIGQTNSAVVSQNPDELSY